MKELLKKMDVLSQECRMSALYLLIKSDGPLYACEIMDALGKKQYQISRCLSALHNAGLVTETREGRFLLYELDTKSDFNKAIFKGILSIDTKENPGLETFLERLKKRIGLRIDGKPSVTYCC